MSNFNSDDNVYNLELHEEQLDIHKKVLQNGDFTIYKETYLENRTITVPITREDIVIKNSDLIETMRIPILEESIEVIKHPVKLEDVKIYDHKFKEISHIEENLKREELHIKTVDDATINTY